MNGSSLVLMLVSVTLSALAQLLFKIGMTGSSRVQSGALVNSLFTTVTNLYVLGGFVCYGVSALLWLYVLARVPLSVAYPFVSLGFVLTTFFGVVLLNEPVHAVKFLGIALIVTGVCLVGR